MARPTKPKEVKEKPESTGAARGGGLLSGGNLTFLIINLVTSVILAAALIGSNYFILNAMMANLQVPGGEQAGEEAAAGEEQAAEEGPVVTHILELEQKVINLSDTDANRYLRVKVSLDLSPGEHAPQAEEEAGAHSSGGAPAEAEDPFEKFRPAIMDAIITILSSKTSEELLTLNGKERAKEEIKEAAESVFQGAWAVIRVNFLEFVVQ